MSTITRFEVIDEQGRALAHYASSIEYQLQDDGRTLKVFAAGYVNDAYRKRIHELELGLRKCLDRLDALNDHGMGPATTKEDMDAMILGELLLNDEL